MGYSPPGFSVHKISQTRILGWVAIPFPGDLPDPGIEPMSPALAGEFFTTEPPGKLRIKYPQVNNGMHIFETLARYCQLSCQRSCPNEITRSYFQKITAAKFFHYFLYPTVKLTHMTYTIWEGELDLLACGEAENERRECFKHLFKKTWAVAGDSSPPLRDLKNQHLEIFLFFFLFKKVTQGQSRRFEM